MSKLNNSFYIPHPSPLEITNISSITESCLGWDGSSSVSVTGGTGPYTYLWSYDDDYQMPVLLENGLVNPLVNSSEIQYLTEGFYYVHIWDINSCYTLDSIFVSTTSSPTLSLLGVVNNLCHDDELGQITFNATRKSFL